jgi:hypothetical protein
VFKAKLKINKIKDRNDSSYECGFGDDNVLLSRPGGGGNKYRVSHLISFCLLVSRRLRASSGDRDTLRQEFGGGGGGEGERMCLTMGPA